MKHSSRINRHVVIVSHHGLPHVGGVEVLVDQEIRALVADGYAVTHITSDLMGNAEAPVYPPGVHVIRIPAWHFLERKARLAYPVFSPRLIVALWRAVGKADVVHAHGFVFTSSVAALIVAAMRGKRRILTDHGGIMPMPNRTLALLMNATSSIFGRITTSLADKLVAYNMRVLGDLERLSRRSDKSLFLPYPIKSDIFKPPTSEQRAAARAQLGWTGERPTVVFAGRITPDKGCLLLLEAKSACFDLVFVGPGDPDILQLPRPGVMYLPAMPHRDLLRIYHAADLFVLPSKPGREGFPLAVREALACGLKVVMSYESGYAPYRQIPNLYFCEELSPAGLRTTIENGLQAPTRPQVHDDQFGLTPLEWIRRMYSGILPLAKTVN
jgi:D-inositol-3-phosphate glycosyltransferase